MKRRPSNTQRTVPRSLWVGIGVLGVDATLMLVSGFHKDSSRLIAAAVLAGALMFGLGMGQKWAYLLTVAFSVLGVAVALGRGGPNAYFVFVGNGLILISVLLSTRFFFAAPSQGSD